MKPKPIKQKMWAVVEGGKILFVYDVKYKGKKSLFILDKRRQLRRCEVRIL